MTPGKDTGHKISFHLQWTQFLGFRVYASTQIKIGMIFLGKQRTHLKNGSSLRKQTPQDLH
jgi:hypothetical protein